LFAFFIANAVTSAGVCGIIRTVVLSRLDVMNYTCEYALDDGILWLHGTNKSSVNFVPYFVWAGAEIAVAMVCLGIPTLRPLYLKQRGQLSIGYDGRSHGTQADEELPQFTMVDQKPPVEFDPSGRDSSSTHNTKVEASSSIASSSIAKPPPAHTKEMPVGYDSVDEIFSLYDQNHQQGGSSQNTGVIWVMSEVQVSRDDLEKANWPLKS
jgi:hypothetical protein